MAPKMPPMPMPPMPIQKSKSAPNKTKTKAKSKKPPMPLAGNPKVGMPPAKKPAGKKLPPFMNPMLGSM